MPRVDAKPHESFERLMSRFKRAVEKSGILKDAHDREYFERPGETRKKAKAAAVARYKKKLELERLEVEQQRQARRQPGRNTRQNSTGNKYERKSSKTNTSYV